MLERLQSRLAPAFASGAETALLGFCAALVIAIWAGVWAQAALERSRALENGALANRNFARILEEHVVRTLNNADQTVRMIKARQEEVGVEFDLARYARTAISSAQPFTHLAVADRNGVIVKSGLVAIPAGIGERDYFRRHVQQDSGELFIGPPEQVHGRPTIFLTRRINAPDGGFGGVALLGLDADYFASLYRQLELGRNGVVALVGRDGIVRARRIDDAATFGEDVRGGALLTTQLDSGEAGTYAALSPIDGVARVFAYRALSDYPLVVVIGSARATILAGARQRLGNYIGVAIVTSGLVILFAALLRARMRRLAALARQVRDSEARLAAMFERAQVGIAEIAADGRWLQVNPRMCEILGYTRDELLAGRVEMVILPDDSQTVRRSRQLLRGGAESFTFEQAYRRKDGTPAWIEVAVTRLRDAGAGSDRLICVAQDVGARRASQAEALRLREQLERRVDRRTAELHQTSSDLESFTYALAHDLRTPLRAVSGFAQILARRQRERMDEQGRHYMDNIIQASAQMGRLIEDILQYARLGRRALTMATIPLDGLLARIRDYLEPRIEAQSAHVRIASGLPTVKGDETLLYQVFVNLLENALTYCKPGTPPQVTVSSNRGTNRVVITVRDEGIGIDPRHFERIFGVFQRLHSEAQYPGTGIGLATVKRSVELLGGKVWVESFPGKGCAFHVSLELAPTAAAPQSTAPGADQALSSPEMQPT